MEASDATAPSRPIYERSEARTPLDPPPSIAADAFAEDFQSILSQHLAHLCVTLTQQHEREVSFLKAQLQQVQSGLSNQTLSKQLPGAILTPQGDPDPSSSSIIENKRRHMQDAQSTDLADRQYWHSESGSQIQLKALFDEDRMDSKESKGSGWHTSPKTEEHMVTGAELKDASGWSQQLVFHPFSVRRIVLDIFNAFVMAFDLTLIPLEVAGIVSITSVLRLLGLLVTIWWTLDMLLSFCAGYQHKGIVELRLSSTACAYIRSWFALDFVLVGIDWFTLILAHLDSSGIARSAKSLRFSRALRILRLSRMFRLPKLFKVANGLQYWLSGDLMAAVLKVGCWILGILFVNHFIACTWFALGDADEGVPTWVDTARLKYREQTDHEANNWYVYATSLHWSLTQFTPASMEVVPVNTYERVFATITIFGALIAFSSFLSSITNEVASLRHKRRDQTNNQAQLVRYLAQNRVSLELGGRLQELALLQQVQSSRVRRVHENDVTLLENMPSSLKEQLRLEVFGPAIRDHPLLRTVSILFEFPFSSICFNAMSQQSLMPNHELFSFGMEAQFMYFVVAGKMVYYHGKNLAAEVIKFGDSHALLAEDALCEQVLVFKWTHRGLLTARMLCEFVRLDAAVFRDAVKAHEDTKNLLKSFGSLYAETLLQRNELELTDLNMKQEVTCGLISKVLKNTGIAVDSEDDSTLMGRLRRSSQRLSGRLSR